MKKLMTALLILSFSNIFAHEIIQSFEVKKLNPNLEKIAESFEIKDQTKNGFIIYVLKEKVEVFKRLAPKSVLLESDINESIRNQVDMTGYHSYEEVKEKYYELAKNYPKFAKIVSYGKSANGRELFALKVSDNVEMNENEPKLMITSATHGDELITVEVQLRLVSELLEKGASSSRLMKMIEDHETYFIPVVNPDGFSKRSRYAGRVDPNRQYPYPERPNRTTSVPCIKNLISFYHQIDFNGSIDIHASGKMVMFPWGYTRDEIPAADFSVMDKLTELMAKDNGYRHGPISKVIYVAKGSSADYYYWKNGGLALAAELTTSKYPRASKIPAVVDEAREMIWKFIESF